MTATEKMQMPSDVELIVPQEITLSTPWLKAIAIYMGVQCEKEMNEFMLLRREYGNDPRKVIKEGKAVTACGVNFIRQLRKSCLKEATEYARCLDDTHGGELLLTHCRQKQYPMDVCVEEKMGIKRPQLGYFSRLHVHESKIKPPPLRYDRDYFAEAAAVREELSKEKHDNLDLDKHRRVRPYINTFTSSD